MMNYYKPTAFVQGQDIISSGRAAAAAAFGPIVHSVARITQGSRCTLSYVVATLPQQARGSARTWWKGTRGMIIM